MPYSQWAHWIFHHEVNSAITVSSLLPLHGELIGWSHEQVTVSSWCEMQTHGRLTAGSQCELQTHGRLTARSQCEIVSWVSCEVDEWLQNELAVSFYVSLQCVCSEVKFFTGKSLNLNIGCEKHSIHWNICQRVCYLPKWHQVLKIDDQRGIWQNILCQIEQKCHFCGCLTKYMGCDELNV